MHCRTEFRFRDTPLGKKKVLLMWIKETLIWRDKKLLSNITIKKRLKKRFIESSNVWDVPKWLVFVMYSFKFAVIEENMGSTSGIEYLYLKLRSLPSIRKKNKFFPQKLSLIFLQRSCFKYKKIKINCLNTEVSTIIVYRMPSVLWGLWMSLWQLETDDIARRNILWSLHCTFI